MSILTISDAIKNVRELPALPVIVLELLSSLDQEDANTHELAEKVSRDQALTAKTLRLANSSFYGMQRKVTTIQQAIAVLGFNSVRTLVTTAAIIGSFSESRHATFDFTAFWRHSISTALCARTIAQQLRANQDIAFMVGLLHDIGRLVLVTHFSAHFAEVVAYQAKQDCYQLQAERAVLGIDHTLIGRALAEHWKFPAMMQRSIESHHEPESQEANSPAAIVHVADCIAHALDLSGDDHDLVPPLSKLAWKGLNIDQPGLMRIFRETETQFEEVSQILMASQKT